MQFGLASSILQLGDEIELALLPLGNKEVLLGPAV